MCQEVTSHQIAHTLYSSDGEWMEKKRLSTMISSRWSMITMSPKSTMIVRVFYLRWFSINRCNCNSWFLYWQISDAVYNQHFHMMRNVFRMPDISILLYAFITNMGHSEGGWKWAKINGYSCANRFNVRAQLIRKWNSVLQIACERVNQKRLSMEMNNDFVWKQ